MGERMQQRKRGDSIGDIHLFFGCQAPGKFIYEEELRSYERDGVLTQLHVAFSRTGKKEYVQHLMKKEASALWQLLQAGGHIFVCGDAKRMAPDVRSAVVHIACIAGGMDETTATAFVAELCTQGEAKRYHEDVWASNA